MKTRQDAWTTEDDLLLAETVLRHIREGSTQLKAFDEVGDKLDRTSAACGFRWNAEVRQNYEEAVQIAKRQRKEMKRALANQSQSAVATKPARSPQLVIDAEFSEELLPIKQTSLSMDDVIAYLRSYQQQTADTAKLEAENQLLRRQNEELKQQNEALEKRLQKLTQQQDAVQEDYQTLVRIMDRARKLVLFDEPEDRMAPIFKMDKNGNLDIVSK
ncbi:RsfA family transcriptional regulator [Ectobacillus funiculus]|uniref:RsfA family transcriptional regulator n=1 Tax=Ectobacillus funiculus TaxID=137993 RepID=A0ABV5WKI4_9BACI